MTEDRLQIASGILPALIAASPTADRDLLVEEALRYAETLLEREFLSRAAWLDRFYAFKLTHPQRCTPL